MTTEPTIHALADLCEQLSTVAMEGKLADAYGRAMQVLRDNVRHKTAVPEALRITEVVSGPDGKSPVAAPCAISGCQYDEVEKFEAVGWYDKMHDRARWEPRKEPDHGALLFRPKPLKPQGDTP